MASGLAIIVMRQFFSEKTGGSRHPAETCAPDQRSIPELWEIHRLLVKSMKLLGLNKGAIGTFRALASLTRINHDPFVFASNRTLMERAEGTSERTIRRHFAALVSAGLIARNDSPNGKRYMLQSGDGELLCFGFDLSPALSLRPQLEELARHVAEEEDLKQFLKRKLGALLYHAGLSSVNPATISELARLKRRKLSSEELQQACSELTSLVEIAPEAHEPEVIALEAGEAAATEMAARNSQNDRHKITSNKTQLDSEEQAQQFSAEPSENDATLLRTVIALSSEAMSYTQERPRCWGEAGSIAFKLAGYMGIHQNSYVQAVRSLGEQQATMSVYALLQISKRVRNLPAYFHAITLGRKAQGFDPVQVLRREARMQ